MLQLCDLRPETVPLLGCRLDTVLFRFTAVIYAMRPLCPTRGWQGFLVLQGPRVWPGSVRTECREWRGPGVSVAPQKPSGDRRSLARESASAVGSEDRGVV